MKTILVYFICISVVSALVTIIDKVNAKNGKRRISEATLFCLSALGGSFFMLITMILIRHKTKHITFMAGIAIIIVLQYIFTGFIIHFLLTH